LVGKPRNRASVQLPPVNIIKDSRTIIFLVFYWKVRGVSFVQGHIKVECGIMKVTTLIHFRINTDREEKKIALCISSP
jgi:hypothetical protein